jgi:hypothetical protein
MFGISYIKVDPTTFVLHYSNGKVQREGAGLSFFYFAPNSSIVAVPAGSTDAPFIFNETTADFQDITIQGQLTFRIVDPRKLAGLLNFTLKNNHKGYVSDDPEKLAQRIINLVQVLTRAEVQHLPLRSALTSSDAIVANVLATARSAGTLATLGVELLAFSILGIRPTPEMSKALEAETREELQKNADEAIYARRNAAVEQERKIKENELNTEIAVEEKKRQVREAQMDAEIAVEEKKRQVREAQMDAEIAVEEKKRQVREAQMDAEIAVEEKKRQVREIQMNADIAMEQQRQTLVKAQADNRKTEADAQAYAVQAIVKPLAGLDPKTLLALAARSLDPRMVVAMGFQEIAGNAAKIGQLNISPDLLDSLLAKK